MYDLQGSSCILVAIKHRPKKSDSVQQLPLKGLDAVDTFVISDGFRVCTEGQRPKAKMGRIEEEMVAPYEDYRRGYNWIGCQEDRNWAVGQDINVA